MSDKIHFRYGGGGALVCDVPIEGVTQELDDETAQWYGGKYFVCETIKKSAASRIAELLGGVLDEDGFKTGVPTRYEAYIKG